MRPHQLIGRLLMVALTVFLIIMLMQGGERLVPLVGKTVRLLGLILFGLYLFDIALLVLRAVQGRLFLLKGFTLITAILTPAFIAFYLRLPPGELSFPLLKYTLSVLLLYYSILNLRRVEITPLAMIIKLTTSPVRAYPLPTVQVTERSDDRIVLSTDKVYELHRSQFFPGQWAKLQEVIGR